MLMKLCNHPRLVANEDPRDKMSSSKGRRASAKQQSYAEEEKSSAAPGADGVGRFMPLDVGCGQTRSSTLLTRWTKEALLYYLQIHRNWYS